MNCHCACEFATTVMPYRKDVDVFLHDAVPLCEQLQAEGINREQ